MVENLFPTHDAFLTRADREKLLKQHSKVIWFTGLSGSGKTTLAKECQKRLHEMGYLTYVLDGDNVRAGINNNLGFSIEGRTENIRRVAEVSKLMIDAGVICLNCFVSPTAGMRKMAKAIIGDANFIEVFVNAPLSICEGRDVKGLYRKARAGKIKDFTGIDSPFEAPKAPNVEVLTAEKSIEQSVELILESILPIIKNGS